MEEWRPIQGFLGYSVSSFGRVRRDSTGRIISVKVNQYGTPHVGLMLKGIQRRRSLAKLVAKAFIPNSNEFFDTPINLDGDRLNCVVENIMWRPRWFAIKYNRQFTQKQWPLPIGAPVRAIETGEVFPGSFEAACRYGLLERDIWESVQNGKVVWPSYMTFELA